MSTTSQPTTFSDLYTALINAVRENSGVTATTVLAKRAINMALHDLHVMGAEKFPWSERRSTITTHPSYSTGTVTATVGSTTLTGSGTAWSTTNSYGQANARAGGKITISGSTEVYEVTAVASGTSLTISPAFIGATASSLSYLYFEDEYALASDFIRPIDVRSFDTGKRIKLIGRQDFRRMYPRNRIPTSNLRHATLLDQPFSGSTTPVRKVQFAPPPSDVQVIPYTYVTMNLAVSSAGTAASGLSSDTDEPIIPLRYRHVLIWGGLVHWYRDRKDDPRSQEVKAEYEQLKARMLGDMEIGAQRPRVTVGTGHKARARSPWSGGRRRYDMNGEFDRLED
jgi:hypothetical protein